MCGRVRVRVCLCAYKRNPMSLAAATAWGALRDGDRASSAARSPPQVTGEAQYKADAEKYFDQAEYSNTQEVGALKPLTAVLMAEVRRPGLEGRAGALCGGFYSSCASWAKRVVVVVVWCVEGGQRSGGVRRRRPRGPRRSAGPRPDPPCGLSCSSLLPLPAPPPCPSLRSWTPPTPNTFPR